MKETAAKRRDRAGGRDRDSKADKPKEAAGAEPQDVDMPEAEATSSVKPPKELDSLTLEDIKEHVKQIEKAVSGKEPRFVLRALRALPSTSRRLNTLVLHKTIGGFFTNNAATRDFLLAFLDEPMDLVDGDVPFRPRTGKAAGNPLLPEVEAYLQLLLVVHLTNNKRFSEAQKVSDDLLQKMASKNRRALDLVAAKCYYYHARVYEFLNQLDSIRSFLHTRLRTATLRHDADGQAVLLNLLLRNYLNFNLYDQAEKLVSKSVFPELANNNEWARYLYYTGRIKAIQLEYSEARRTLTNALRKAPQHTAVGFKQTVGAHAHTPPHQEWKLAIVFVCCLRAGAQAADRGGVAAGRNSRQASVQAAVAQEVTHALLPAHSGGENGQPVQVQPSVGAVWREVPDGRHVHAHHPPQTQRHQDRRAYDQPVVLAHLAGRHRAQAAAGQSRGRGVHRGQGHPRRRDRGEHQPRERLRPVQGDHGHLRHPRTSAGLSPEDLLLPRHSQHVCQGHEVSAESLQQGLGVGRGASRA
ncbi:26S proteasome non-ATPase regulatory subunit 3 isoform X1 [Phyllopteryx taeniolatus]|uniref:26S proteasome non-ATPase regulatory subunit 3 isoform X1 n=1 Tax=Phyllopteryx taeniolatus TaxID=161469 RepID=UPI002AD5A774|nr:26S proteasome non-ATPase regulatory subunit 3 isoform X1 [Phyllopteryx taeniolatus]